MSSKRWGTVNEREISNIIESSVPKNTVVNKQSQWRQFSEFCGAKNYKIDASTTIPELAMILKDYAVNMKRRDGTDYKESVIKTLWNATAKSLQETFFKKHNIKFNPFEDIEFLEARKARDAKRKELQKRPEKRKISAAAFTLEEHSKMMKLWDENTPEGLQKKFYIIASKELAWRGNEAAYAMTYHFKIEKDNCGDFTGRVEYNPIFSKTNQGGSKRCASSKWLIKNVNEDNCPVRLYFKILEKRPQNATTDRFFLTENPNWENSCWYKNCPIGINKLSSWTKESAKKIGLDIVNKKFTNHSNRSTAITHLANANIPDQQLMKITGHTNSNSIQSYLNMQPEHHQQIINSMRGNLAEDDETNVSISASTSLQNQPTIVYKNCTFNVQNMY